MRRKEKNVHRRKFLISRKDIHLLICVGYLCEVILASTNVVSSLAQEDCEFSKRRRRRRRITTEETSKTKQNTTKPTMATPAPRTRTRTRTSFLALAGFLVLFIACVAAARKRKQQARREEMQMQMQMLPPVMALPQRRKRALTPPPSARALRAEKSRRVNSQWRSVLFAKLPGEIRELVYEMLLGGEVLHIVGRAERVRHRGRERQRKAGVYEDEEEYLRLGHVKCFGRCQVLCRHEANFALKCWDCYALDGDRKKRRRRANCVSRVGFLQSCRRM